MRAGAIRISPRIFSLSRDLLASHKLTQPPIELPMRRVLEEPSLATTASAFSTQSLNSTVVQEAAESPIHAGSYLN